LETVDVYHSLYPFIYLSPDLEELLSCIHHPLPFVLFRLSPFNEGVAVTTTSCNLMSNSNEVWVIVVATEAE